MDELTDKLMDGKTKTIYPLTLCQGYKKVDYLGQITWQSKSIVVKYTVQDKERIL